MMTRAEAKELLQFDPDGSGECDRCHCNADLWVLDPHDAAEWMYCRDCLLATTERKAVSHAQ